MIALKLVDKKTFMNQLLCSEIFDHFLLQKATIVKDAAFTIDGRLHASYYSRKELDEEGLSDLSYLPYARLRQICYQLMRGSRTPVSFQFILMLSPENIANTLSHSESSFTQNDISGIFINLSFQKGQITLTTGISYTIFSTERLLDQEWDTLIRKFLYKHAITFEEL